MYRNFRSVQIICWKSFWIVELSLVSTLRLEQLLLPEDTKRDCCFLRTGSLCVACSLPRRTFDCVTCIRSTRRARTPPLCAQQPESPASSGGGGQRRLLRECSRASCTRDRYVDLRSFATRLEWVEWTDARADAGRVAGLAALERVARAGKCSA